VDFHMSTGADAFTVTYIRLKPQADGAPGLQAAAPFLVTGKLKDTPQPAYQVDCGWQADFSLAVPADWGSGLYAASCQDTAGYQFYVVFVVRPSPASHTDFAVLANTHTWTAYNDWGGRSQYTNPNAALLSLRRPNPGTTPIDDHQLNHLTRAESWVLGWLEDRGNTLACNPVFVFPKASGLRKNSKR